MNQNTEQRARAVCALDLQAVGTPIDERTAAIDWFWPVVAAEIQGDLFDRDGRAFPPDLVSRTKAYARLRRARFSWLRE